MLNEENLDFMLSNSPYSEIQRKRIHKEIEQIATFHDFSLKQALVMSHNGLIIKLEILNSFFKNKGGFTKTSIFFHLVLDLKYPFAKPKLLCITKFCEPSLADGRDYIPFILKKPWSPNVLLVDLVRKVPDFINTVLVYLELEDKFSLLGLGNYYLGEHYDLNDIINYPGMAVFPSMESLDMDTSVFRYLAISEAHFLTFEPKRQGEHQKKDDITSQSIVNLVSWAPLTALTKLNRRKNSTNSSTIILSWHDYRKKEGLLQIIQMNEEGRFVELLLKNLRKLHLQIEKTVFKQPDLRLEDVTVHVFRDLDRTTLVNTIEEIEKKAAMKMDHEIMDSSMRLYQKAIEYFSALNDPLYDTYLKKLQEFLQRENVKEFLESREEKV